MRSPVRERDTNFIIVDLLWSFHRIQPQPPPRGGPPTCHRQGKQPPRPHVKLPEQGLMMMLLLSLRCRTIRTGMQRSARALVLVTENSSPPCRFWATSFVMRLQRQFSKGVSNMKMHWLITAGLLAVPAVWADTQTAVGTD